jgi:hypothetical protein
MKTYVGISRDHSGSMGSISEEAARDYNSTIASIKRSAAKEEIDTIVSVIKCGVRAPGRYAVNVREAVNSSISVLKPLKESEYDAKGQSTPLFDSVSDLIQILKSSPDSNDPEVTFLVNVITDGDDNCSEVTGHELGQKIRSLQATDRWTFVFRVPRGEKAPLVRMGIPAGNIYEWEQTEEGLRASTQATDSGISSYFSSRSAGVRSTQNFYTDLSDVSVSTIKANLDDISKQVKFWTVQPSEDGEQIRTFCEKRLRKDMKKGAAFYQLMKTETLQDYKLIAIVDRKSGKVYSGPAARDLLNLPPYGAIKLAPGDHGQFEIFVQSTSVNRKLPQHTKVLYWDNVGVSFKS